MINDTICIYKMGNVYIRWGVYTTNVIECSANKTITKLFIKRGIVMSTNKVFLLY